jgi:hypothetical protein
MWANEMTELYGKSAKGVMDRQTQKRHQMVRPMAERLLKRMRDNVRRPSEEMHMIIC